ncbi:MAG TPA: hypothetical protein QGF02_04255 [Candidatus Babeliales bacterium]|nr:hypothetical protein [Candidatus Babeliales bacterium]
MKFSKKALLLVLLLVGYSSTLKPGEASFGDGFHLGLTSQLFPPFTYAYGLTILSVNIDLMDGYPKSFYAGICTGMATCAAAQLFYFCKCCK